MSNQLYFEDITVGQEIPSLEKSVNTVNITMYLSAVWLIDRIHFDYPFATQRRGLPNIVAPGNMATDYYVQLLSGWAGEKGNLRKMSVQFRNFMVPGDILVCGGKVTAKVYPGRERLCGAGSLDKEPERYHLRSRQGPR